MSPETENIVSESAGNDLLIVMLVGKNRLTNDFYCVCIAKRYSVTWLYVSFGVRIDDGKCP